MFDGEYSKRVWIISIIMAIGCIVMDIFIMLGEDGIMKDTVWMTLPFSALCMWEAVYDLYGNSESCHR